MNQKQTRKYSLIENIFKSDFGSPMLPSAITELSSICFDTAAEVWEYTLTKNVNKLPQNSQVMVDLILDVFLKQSTQKTINYIYESLPIVKLIFGGNSLAGTDHTLNILANAIVANKIDIADNMLMALRNNTSIDFNVILKGVVERVFENYCAKNNTKVPVLNRKQKALLLAFVSKIKGPNKLLLEQRIKELG